MIRTLILLTVLLSVVAEARISTNTPPYLTDYDDLDRLEAMGCAYPTFRALLPQAHWDLKTAIVNGEDAQESCQAPKWLLKQRAVMNREMLANEARFETILFHNDQTPLLGTEATVTPVFPLRQNRITFNGPNIYTELMLNAEMNYGDWGLAASVTPGWVGALDDYAALNGRLYLQEGYVKVGYRWTEVTFGREAMRFGNTAHGSLLLSAATNPIDQLKLSMRPHLLGGFLDYLGPVTLETFFTPPLRSTFVNNSRLWGIQLGMRPFSWLELAFLELFQFGGDRVPGANLSDFLKMIPFGGGADLDSRRNKTLGLHLSLWMPSHRARLYGQLMFDTLGSFTDDISTMVGLYVPRLTTNLEARLEYVHTVARAYTNTIWKQGLSYEGSPLGHPIGPDGQALYLDFGFPLFGDWRTSAGFLYEARGQNLSAPLLAESRLGGNLGVKKRWAALELDARLMYQSIQNPLYQTGPSANAVAGFGSFRYTFF